MRRRAFAAGAILLAVAVAVAAAVWLRPRASNAIVASGTIEATESNVSSKVQGRIDRVLVQDGDAVRKGQVLAILEAVDPTLNVAQARANVAAAAAGAVHAQEGIGASRASVGQSAENLAIERESTGLQIDQAREQMVSAESTYEHAAVELKRAQSLVASGDEPQESLDGATVQYRVSSAQLQAARDGLALAYAGARSVRVREYAVRAAEAQSRQSVSQFRTAQAQLDQARAAAGLAEDQLRETRLLAPYAGYVISHNYEAGDLVGPGSPVMTVGDLAHPYLYVYLNETELPRVHQGMRADVTVDGLPGRVFAGTVTEIAGTAEFTPENVQTERERIEYLVFRVKIQFDDTTMTLKPGLPADATIRA